MKRKVNLMRSKALVGTLLIFLCFTVIFGGLPAFSTAQPPQSAQPGSAQFEKPISLDVRISPVVREPATNALLSVQIANSSEKEDEVTLVKFKVFKEDGKVVKEFTFNRSLNPIGKDLKRRQELEDILGITEEKRQSEEEISEEELEMIEGDAEASGPEIQEDQSLSQEDATLTLERFKELVEEYGKLKEKIQKETIRTDITLDLSELKKNLRIGDSINLEVDANFQLNKKQVSKNRYVSVEYQSSLPSLPNWHPGDGHMHTNWSDGKDHPQVMAAEAKWKGLSWVAITDHDYDLALRGGSLAWSAEKTECEAAEALLGIPVMLGEELGFYRGHYLAYNIPTYLNWTFRILWVSNQQIIDEVNDVGGFGIIAHPHAKGRILPWKDWTVTGYTGLEVMNYGKPPPHQTSARWDENILKRSSWVGTGNSDAHSYIDVGKSRTYCYIEGSPTHESIYGALKKGRCVATNGPLVAFQIGDHKIGGTAKIPRGQSVKLNFSWASTAEFGNLKKIWVIYNDRIIDRIPLDSPTGTLSKSYSVSEPGYFRIFAKSINASHKSFYAYTNPIWVELILSILTFEDLVEGQYVGTHYPGLTFSSAWRCADTATGRYNTAGYPPHSGTKAVWTGFTENWGTITFDEPVRYAEAWFSAAYGVIMEGYDSSGRLVASGSLGRVYGYSAPIRLESTTRRPIKTLRIHDYANYWTMDDLSYY